MLIPIDKDRELERVRHLKIGMLEEPAHFDLHWVKQHGWTVVPVQSGSHFDRNDAVRLARAFGAVECPQVFALSTEKARPGWPDSMSQISIEAFLIGTSVEGLLEFSRVCAHFNFVLVPSNRLVAVISTVYDYYLVGGPGDFVEIAVGGDIKAAWDRFEECAQDPMWEGRLLKVAKRYRNIVLPAS